MEMNNQTLRFKMLKWNILTNLIFFSFWKQTLPSIWRYKYKFFYGKCHQTQLLAYSTSYTDSQLVAKEGISVPCTKLHGGDLCSVFCTLHLHQARSQYGSLLFWFCKQEQAYSYDQEPAFVSYTVQTRLRTGFGVWGSFGGVRAYAAVLLCPWCWDRSHPQTAGSGEKTLLFLEFVTVQ